MGRAGSGLQRLIGLLLVLNAATLLAGWAGGYFFAKPTTLVTFNADKIQLLDERVPERETASSPAERGGVSPLPAEPTAGVRGTEEASECAIWLNMEADRLAQIQGYLRGLGVPDAAYDILVDTRLGWWVYLPPVADATALSVVMEDARAKGIKDMSPVRTGKLANALSLGVFPDLESARLHAASMEKKGLQGVQFAPRPEAGAARLTTVKAVPALQSALRAPWPAGLAPDGCKR